MKLSTYNKIESLMGLRDLRYLGRIGFVPSGKCLIALRQGRDFSMALLNDICIVIIRPFCDRVKRKASAQLKRRISQSNQGRGFELLHELRRESHTINQG